VLIAQRHVQGAEIVFKPLEGSRAQYGCGHGWVEQGPGERDLCLGGSWRNLLQDDKVAGVPRLGDHVEFAPDLP
jgi:hypothetical protein